MGILINHFTVDTIMYVIISKVTFLELVLVFYVQLTNISHKRDYLSADNLPVKYSGVFEMIIIKENCAATQPHFIIGLMLENSLLWPRNQVRITTRPEPKYNIHFPFGPTGNRPRVLLIQVTPQRSLINKFIDTLPILPLLPSGVVPYHREMVVICLQYTTLNIYILHRKESLESVYSSNSRLNLLNKRKRLSPLDMSQGKGDRYVAQRVLSAKAHRVKQLQNQLADAHYHLQASIFSTDTAAPSKA